MKCITHFWQIVSSLSCWGGADDASAAPFNICLNAILITALGEQTHTLTHTDIL